MNLIKFILSIFIGLLLLMACEKECLDIRSEQVNIGYTYFVEEISYKAPSFHPDSADTILFVKENKILGERYLIKKALSTGEEIVLVNHPFLHRQPKWGRQDWILFNLLSHSGVQIGKVNSNGKKMEQLTNRSTNLEYSWSPSGTHFLSTSTLDGGVQVFLNDCSENYIRKIEGTLGAKFAEWSPDSNFIAFTKLFETQYLTLLEIKTNKHIQLQEINFSNPFVHSISWHPNSKDIFWSTPSGIYRTSITNQETERIKESCHSNEYAILQVAPTGDGLIVEKIKREVVEPKTTTIKEDYSIWTMDLSGKNECLLIE